MNLGLTEMLFIFVLALLIFGPRKLPELGRQLGRALTEFRRASNEFKYQIENEMRQLELDDTAGHTVAPPPGTSTHQTAQPRERFTSAEENKSADA